MLYLCLEKTPDGEGGVEDWRGVVEGEDQQTLNYANLEQDFDVEEYVKSMGYDRERDAHKVDKTMFSSIAEEFRENLMNNTPASMKARPGAAPAVVDPVVSPEIETGV
ncbi:unnamed protein product, partial [Discosporangium mesarthrocarpum]